LDNSLRKNSNKPWERSQSAVDLKNKVPRRSSVPDSTYGTQQQPAAVSEQSKVYWDLSQAEDELREMAKRQGAGKLKISLQTIHQKEEMSPRPQYTIKTRVVRRVGSTDSLLSDGETSAASHTEYQITGGSDGGAGTTRTEYHVKAPTDSGSRTTRTEYHVTGGTEGSSSKTSRREYHVSEPSETTHTEYREFTLPGGETRRTSIETTKTESTDNARQEIPSSGVKRSEVKFSFSSAGKPNLTVTLEQAVPLLQENIRLLRAPTLAEQCAALQDMRAMIEQAWATPTIGRDLAYSLCDILRTDGGLDILIENCGATTNYDIQLNSALVLEQSMTVDNREAVAGKGLEIIINLAKTSQGDRDVNKAVTGILQNLFKHSEDTCTHAIKFGGLELILSSCRTVDVPTLRYCAEALANLAMYGGSDNQHKMVMQQAPEWLFPLAFCDDDTTRYYAFLAIAALSANREIEARVVKSGTLELVKPFIMSHDPCEFANADEAHIHGQSREWLRHLIPLLTSRREEAQSLAAFHFAMEAGIKVEQGKADVFAEIGAIEPLRCVACGTNNIAAQFAASALRVIGENVPYTLSPQVPLWTALDVTRWLQQVGFGDEHSLYAFNERRVDGDVLLCLDDKYLKEDLDIVNGITRYIFMRELRHLKQRACYDSCDPSHLDDWLKDIDFRFAQYSYQMLKAGVDRRFLSFLNETHLQEDCKIDNGLHRLRILEAARHIPSKECTLLGLDQFDSPLGKPPDVFISYRRSNGSQLASLLKVHLQLRGFTCFLDIEKLPAGKFDDNLLNSVRCARNFILVLTPGCLTRCIGDEEQKDWVHREVVAALQGGCNIIPVTDNFEWPAPEELPEDMRPVCYFNGIRWIHDYQDACVGKLEQFIRGEDQAQNQQRSVSGPSSISGPSSTLPQTGRPMLSKANSLSSNTGSIHGAQYADL